MRRFLFGMGVALSLAAPAAAQAATVQMVGDTATYTAARGEATRLRVDMIGPDGRVPFTDFGAPIQVGAGCIAGTPVLCGFNSPVEVRLSDGDDVASVDPFATDADANGGTGDDDLYVNGEAASAEGGSGDDILRVAANDAAIAVGGAGDDVLIGSTFAFDEFSGGAGDDLVMPLGTAGATATGDSGDDALVTTEAVHGGGTLDGGSGADVITYLTPPSRLPNAAFVGGTGNDTIAGPAKTVDGGSGSDTIDVTGGVAPTTVTCGTGHDVVYADADDVVGADCEQVLPGPAPDFPAVDAARARAQAMRTHFPQP